MEDDFLANYLIVYIEKEIAERFTIDMIIDNFYSMKQRRAQLPNSSCSILPLLSILPSIPPHKQSVSEC
jgi:hypothetical protein